MKRVIVIVLGVFLVLAQPAYAGADTKPDQYTDGTETYPPNVCIPNTDVCTAADGTGFGIIPYGPEWVEECEVIEFDPPTIVWVTIHIDYGPNGTEDEYLVVPYERTTPAVVEANIKELIDGFAGEVYLTWNFGSGETAHLSFDCVPEIATTTTTAPSASTTTSSTIGNDNAESTTTTIETIDILPVTGSSSSTGPLAIIGIGIVSGGLLLARYGRRN